MIHLLKWLYPGMKLKRWLLLFAIGVLMFSFGGALAINYEYLSRVEEEIFMLVYRTVGSYNYTITTAVGIFILIIGASLMLYSTRSIIRSIIAVLIPDRSENLVDMIYLERKLGRGPAITVIGGGHGGNFFWEKSDAANFFMRFGDLRLALDNCPVRHNRIKANMFFARGYDAPFDRQNF